LPIIFLSLSTLTLSCPCTFTQEGRIFDLSPLNEAGVISGTDSNNIYTYQITICNNSVPQPCELSNGLPPFKLYCPEGVGYCQQGRIGGGLYGFCVGVTSFPQRTTVIPGKGLEIIYTEPFPRVPGDGMARLGKVIINCNPGGPLISNIRAISPAVVDGYEFHFDSYTACPLGDDIPFLELLQRLVTKVARYFHWG